MTCIGHYRIKKQIGEGSFGRVYQAEHVRLKQVVCLKVGKNPFPEFTKLLRHEAGIIRRLSGHPAIPAFKNFMIAENNTGVLVMDFIEGCSLAQWLKRGNRMGAERACLLTALLLEALRFCHQQGVVHGDLKPDNLMLTKQGCDLKLIDFGVASFEPGSCSRALGFTLFYAAPESLRNLPPIPETDIFGAGWILLCALGGDPLTQTLPGTVPKAIREFCGQLMDPEPMRRPCWERKDPLKWLNRLLLETF
ncbi:MAG: serine/threonine protein kinase [Desulfobacteraceae bacterium]|nr:MAG: serine/threonine protein kinase [Desulfobacteraceae bacterium]